MQISSRPKYEISAHLLCFTFNSYIVPLNHSRGFQCRTCETDKKEIPYGATSLTRHLRDDRGDIIIVGIHFSNFEILIIVRSVQKVSRLRSFIANSVIINGLL